VGLLNALHSWRGEQVSAGQLAQEAAHIEIDVLQRPIGKQDHYAAAFGGFSFLRFLADGGVSVEPQRFAPDAMRELFDHLVLFWTGISRSAHEVLSEQRANTPARLTELTQLREHAHRLQALLRDGFDPLAFGRCLDEGWQIKRRLASGITDHRIDEWCRRAMRAGAIGGKILGAGGGGFLLFVVPPASQLAVREALQPLSEIRTHYEPHGSRVLIPHGD
jgi:D-glycero-alpha-D-manno-heptose-7-phosphate kinase